MFWVLKDKLYPTKSITRHSGTQFKITIISPTKMTTSFALQKTIFATIKKKLADAENRVRELQNNNEQVRTLQKENEFLRLKQTRMLNLAK